MTSTIFTPHAIAKALGGEVSGNQVRAPGPGHSARDRSLSIKTGVDADDGFVVHSFAGDDPILCRDYVRERMGVAPFRPGNIAVRLRARRSRQADVPRLEPLAKSTTDALDWLIKYVDDAERLERFLEGRPQSQIEAMLAYIERKKS
jgi:hypothetical protein